MAKIKLTEAFVGGLDPANNRIYYDSETRGFAVRVTPKGFRGFLFCYTFDGRERRMPIGHWERGASTVTQARTRAATLRLKLQSGVDPMAEKLEAREAREAARQQAAKESTFEKLAERYIEEHAKFKRTGPADVRRIRKYVLPSWGTRKVKDISRADVDALVAPLAVEGKRAEANHRLALVRKMFSFAIDKSIIDVHPCLRMRSPGGAVVARDRALTTPFEFRLFWRVTNGGLWKRIVPPCEAGALRLMLLTGCRPTEAAEARWSEFDLVQNSWTLPASRTKNKRAHVIPLVQAAVSLLRAREGESGELWAPV